MSNKVATDEAATATGTSEKYVLELYVTGATPNSVRAISNITNICRDLLAGNVTLEIIDVYNNAVVAEREQLIALPMLIKRAPLPLRKLIGDLSNSAKVSEILGIKK